jgi:hypothetical protein
MASIGHRSDDWDMRLAQVVAAGVAAVAHLLLHWQGTAITEDGWAYWQGAVNLAERGEYSYFSGDPILAWPPLYSLYLAGWTWLFGPSAATIVLANGMLIVAQAWAWTGLVLYLANEGGQRPARLNSVLCALFAGLFLALNQRWVLAHNLLYLLLPALILLTWRVARSSGQPSWTVLFGLAVVGTAMLLTHNSAVVFLVASAIAAVGLQRPSVRASMSTIGAVLAGPLAVWWAVRQALGQVGSHALGAARDTPLAYLKQAFLGVGDLVGTSLSGPYLAACMIGIGLYVLAWRREPARLLVVTFALVPVAALVALFSLTWVNDDIAGRFLLSAPLLAGGLLLLSSGQRAPLVALTVALATLPLLVYRTGKWAFDNPHAINARVFVPIEAELSRQITPGTIESKDGRLLVGPSQWQERRGRSR